MKNFTAPVEVSARHLHLSPDDFTTLFGTGAVLKRKMDISQPGQFAANETVRVVGPRSEFLAVRIVGPLRKETQLELAITDGYRIGVEPTLTVSGQLDGTAGDVILMGPKGKLVLKQGVIVAKRHLHIEPSLAQKYGLTHLGTVTVKTNGTRPVAFHDVVVRSREGIDRLSFQIDTDEANAAGLKTGDQAEVVINGA